MPKVRSQRSISGAHTPSARPVNRSFAVQDNAVQHIDIGALKDTSADQILHSVNTEDVSHPQHTPNKKAKRILKHELFIERLEASRVPYSKSHARRLKRKEKEQLMGDMESLKTALPSITSMSGKGSAGEYAALAMVDTTTSTTGASSSKLSANAKFTLSPDLVAPTSLQPQPVRPGQIGEGKGTPLTRSQRRRALKAERFRQPLILANPTFAAHPFETIRIHARNTLVPHKSTTQ